LTLAALVRRVRSLERRTPGAGWLIIIEKSDTLTVDDALAKLGLSPGENETVLAVNRYCDDASTPRFLSRHPLKAAAKNGGRLRRR
jgi:hypothetical protein